MSEEKNIDSNKTIPYVIAGVITVTFIMIFLLSNCGGTTEKTETDLQKISSSSKQEEKISEVRFQGVFPGLPSQSRD